MVWSDGVMWIVGVGVVGLLCGVVKVERGGEVRRGLLGDVPHYQFTRAYDSSSVPSREVHGQPSKAVRSRHSRASRVLRICLHPMIIQMHTLSASPIRL